MMSGGYLFAFNTASARLFDTGVQGFPGDSVKPQFYMVDGAVFVNCTGKS